MISAPTTEIFYGKGAYPYSPKPHTVFVHLEHENGFGDNPAYVGRIFAYYGGLGFAYQYDDEHRNCNMPLKHEEFVELPSE